MTGASGLLLVGLDFESVAEDEFHAWYDTEHLPERRRVPGFRTAQRWLGRDNARVSVATYDLEDVGVLQERPYKSIAGENFSPWSKRVMGRSRALCRFEAIQCSPGRQDSSSQASGMLVVAFDPATITDAERFFWIDGESAPRTPDLPGLLTCRSFKSGNGCMIVICEHQTLSPSDLDAWRGLAPGAFVTPAFSGPLWTLLLRKRAVTS